MPVSSDNQNADLFVVHILFTVLLHQFQLFLRVADVCLCLEKYEVSVVDAIC